MTGQAVEPTRNGLFPASGRSRALLIDVGGVLTTNVFDAFARVSDRVCGDPQLIRRLFTRDDHCRRLLAEHERGRISEQEFDAGLAARLRAHGAPEIAPGLIGQFHAELAPDEAMHDAVRRIRAHGVPVAIVSNALGDDCYSGMALETLSDVAVLSHEVGTRKPERRIYEIACERLSVDPAACVLIDDLSHNLLGAARLGIRGLLHTDSARTIHLVTRLLGIQLR